MHRTVELCKEFGESKIFYSEEKFFQRNIAQLYRLAKSNRAAVKGLWRL